MGSVFMATQCFLHGLALALLPSANEAQRQSFRDSLNDKVDKLGVVRFGPANFEHRHALLSAEVARLEGRESDAMRDYERAIHGARANGFVHYESLARELASRFYRDRGFAEIADTYLRSARAGLRRAGATGKVRQINRRHPWLERGSSGDVASMVGTSVERQDLLTMGRVSQAISEELVLEKLVESLLRLALHHTGAQCAVLALWQDGVWTSEARARTAEQGIEIVLERVPLTGDVLPLSILQAIEKTQQKVLLDDASASVYAADESLGCAIGPGRAVDEAGDVAGALSRQPTDTACVHAGSRVGTAGAGRAGGHLARQRPLVRGVAAGKCRA